jgi:hypothetical protein
MKLFGSSTRATPAPPRGRSRSHVVLIAGTAVAALVATGAVAQAAGAHGATSRPRTAAAATSYSLTPHLLSTGDLSYGSWQGHPIVVPAVLAPGPGNRLTSILVGRGVLVFTCTAGAFTLTEPLFTLFSPEGRPVGLFVFDVPIQLTATRVFASTVDGSRSNMMKVREIPTKNTVTRVLNRAVSTAGGPRTRFGGTTFMVRVPIAGGVAPTTCTITGQRIGVPLLTFFLVFKSGTSKGGTTP